MQVTGAISVYNPNPVQVTDIDITDSIKDNAGAAIGGASCSVASGTDLMLGGKATTTVQYMCMLTGATNGINTATATWDPSVTAVNGATLTFTDTSDDGTAPFTFSSTPTTTVRAHARPGLAGAW
jgi:hypothetical protein